MLDALTTLFEVLMAGQFIHGQTHRVGPVYLLQMARLHESASRRYLAAIEKLARVRKLQANTPGIRFNTQINLGGRQPVRPETGVSGGSNAHGG